MKKNKVTFVSTIVGALAGLLICSADEPGWWTTRNVVNGNPPQPNAAANVGQLQHLATQAEAEMNEKLPGGAGADVGSVVDQVCALEPNTQALPIGLLKATATPFYDRFQSLMAQNASAALCLPEGIPGIYPWTVETIDDQDDALASLAQLKYVFSFDPSKYVDGDGDADNDGMLDEWEVLHGLDPQSDDSAGDPDGDGVSNLDEFLQGIDPTKEDSDGDTYGDGEDDFPAQSNAYLDTDLDGMPDCFIDHKLDHEGLVEDLDDDADGLLDREEVSSYVSYKNEDGEMEWEKPEDGYLFRGISPQDETLLKGDSYEEYKVLDTSCTEFRNNRDYNFSWRLPYPVDMDGEAVHVERLEEMEAATAAEDTIELLYLINNNKCYLLKLIITEKILPDDNDDYISYKAKVSYPEDVFDSADDVATYFARPVEGDAGAVEDPFDRYYFLLSDGHPFGAMFAEYTLYEGMAKHNSICFTSWVVSPHVGRVYKDWQHLVCGTYEFYPVVTLSDPKDTDYDEDGWSLKQEVAAGTDPYLKDTDGDTISDPDEHDSDPTKFDTDGDGLNDKEEQEKGTNAWSAHSDGNVLLGDLGDGLPDGLEVYLFDHQSAPLDPSEDDGDVSAYMALDTDSDGLTNQEELDLGTDPLDPDTDGDTLIDGYEVNISDTNPLSGPGETSDPFTVAVEVAANSGMITPSAHGELVTGGPFEWLGPVISSLVSGNDSAVFEVSCGNSPENEWVAKTMTVIVPQGTTSVILKPLIRSAEYPNWSDGDEFNDQVRWSFSSPGLDEKVSQEHNNVKALHELFVDGGVYYENEYLLDFTEVAAEGLTYIQLTGRVRNIGDNALASSVEIYLQIVADALTVDVSIDNLKEETEPTPNEEVPGAFIGVNDNDNDGEPGSDLVDRPEGSNPLNKPDQDLKHVKLSVIRTSDGSFSSDESLPSSGESLPRCGKVSLIVPANLKVWDGQEKQQLVEKLEWDLSKERSDFQVIMRKGLWMEALGEVNGNVILDYASGEVSDKVKISSVKLDIIKVPAYIFSSAKNWTPIRFELKSGAEINSKNIQFTKISANMCIGASDGGSVGREIIDSFTGLEGFCSPYIVEAKEVPNVFECYINPSEYASVSFPESTFYENAYFELEVSLRLGPEGGELEFTSDRCSQVGEKSAGQVKDDLTVCRFVDKSVYAIDIKDNQNAETITRSDVAGAFYRLDPRQRWETVELGEHWNRWLGWVAGTGIEYKRVSRDYTDSLGELPYWESPLEPMWSEIHKNLITGVITDPHPHGNVTEYETAYLDSELGWTGRIEGEPALTLESFSRQYKDSDRESVFDVRFPDNVFSGKNIGLRDGVYAFISYGGKSPVCLNGAKAMDLSKNKGRVELDWCLVSAEVSAKSVVEPQSGLVGLTLNAGWALGGSYAGSFFGVAASLYSYLGGLNTAGDSKAFAKVEAWRMVSSEGKVETQWSTGSTDMYYVRNCKSIHKDGTPNVELLPVKDTFAPEPVGTMCALFLEMNTVAQQESRLHSVSFPWDARREVWAKASAKSSGKDSFEIRAYTPLVSPE